MGLALQFDARAVVPASVDGGAEQLPVSDGLGHRVIICGDAQVPTKANKESNGADPSVMLVLKLQIIDGPHSGLKGDYRLNIGNASPQSREIAYKQLSAICHAIGAFAISNTQELWNKPFRVVVVPQSDPKYTEIKGVLSDQGIDPGNPTAGPRQAGNVPQPQQVPQPQTFQPPAAQQPAFQPQQQPQPAFQPPATQQPVQQPQPQPQQPAAQVWQQPLAGGAPPPAPWGQQPR